MRAYTVVELDALREVVKSKWLYRWYVRPKLDFGFISTGGYNEVEVIKIVEEMVRTHMLAGHTADDLIKSEDEERARAEAAMAMDRKTE